MIHLNGVTDEPYAFGSRQPLLAGADLDIPVGRYALLSPAPELHRQIVDVLCGLRPPRQGFVKHEGSVSWAIGRQGFIRGKATGLNMIELTCQMYEIDADATRELVADLVSDPGAAHGTLAAACAAGVFVRAGAGAGVRRLRDRRRHSLRTLPFHPSLAGAVRATADRQDAHSFQLSPEPVGGLLPQGPDL